MVHLAEGQFLKDGLTESKGKSRTFLVGPRKPILSVEDRQDLQPKDLLMKNTASG